MCCYLVYMGALSLQDRKGVEDIEGESTDHKTATLTDDRHTQYNKQCVASEGRRALFAKLL